MNRYRLITNASFGIPEPEPIQAPNAWRLFARLDQGPTPNFCLWQCINQLVTNDQKAALSAIHKIIQVAATGDALTAHYDKKQCHDIHSFEYPKVPPENHTIYRIWKGSKVRLTFYYTHNRSILLINAFSKKEDKLTRQQQTPLEEEVKLYLEESKKQNFKIET